MAELQRITTHYSETQDRIRLAGELGGGEASVVLWLSQRLVQRLLPILLHGVTGRDNDAPYSEMLHSFAQQSARAALTPEPPVRADQAETEWLVHSVVVNHFVEAMRLTFKGADDQQATLTLAVQPLRQWLNILYDAFAKAGWPLDQWPQWIQESMLEVHPTAVQLH